MIWKKICERLFGGDTEATVSDERQSAMVQELLLGEAANRQAARDAKRVKPKRRKRALPSLFNDEVAGEIKRQLTAYEHGTEK